MRSRISPLLVVALLAGCRAASPSSLLAAVRPVGEDAFDWTLGEWHGIRRAADDGSEAPLVMRVTSVLGGAGQVRELEVRHAGGIYRGLAVQVYVPSAGPSPEPSPEATGRWVRQYVNATRRRFAQLEGGPQPDGQGSLWRSADPGAPTQSRVVSRRLGPDRWTRTVSRSTDSGTTWSEVFTDELRRRAR